MQSPFDCSILFAYNFFSSNASKSQLVSFERSFKKLSKAHEFQLILFKNGDTVISQTTVEIRILSPFDWSTLFAYYFLSSKASKTRLVSFERFLKNLLEPHEFQLIWSKNGNTVNTQSTVVNRILSPFDWSTLFAYNFFSSNATGFFKPMCRLQNGDSQLQDMITD